ncbi:hypothetical protein [Kitasatospora sp. NPDC001547]|uniref:hypothetical protein n=1 Tax=Kitasatospora sp. NPDC001547 TaxID=3364015 RepID=UPI003674ABF5
MAEWQVVWVTDVDGWGALPSEGVLGLQDLPSEVARTSASESYATCNEWMRLARWLHQRRIDDLGACTAQLWRAYLAERLADITRNSAVLACGRLTDLWAFDGLSVAPIGIVQPPWETEGLDDSLPAADRGSGENATEPLDPQVLGPLLIWSIRFVDDFADDILAASAERDRRPSAPPRTGRPRTPGRHWSDTCCR